MVNIKNVCEKLSYITLYIYIYFFKVKQKFFLLILLLSKLDPANCSAAVQLLVQIPSRVVELPSRVA